MNITIKIRNSKKYKLTIITQYSIELTKALIIIPNKTTNKTKWKNV